MVQDEFDPGNSDMVDLLDRNRVAMRKYHSKTSGIAFFNRAVHHKVENIFAIRIVKSDYNKIWFGIQDADTGYKWWMQLHKGQLAETGNLNWMNYYGGTFREGDTVEM